MNNFRFQPLARAAAAAVLGLALLAPAAAQVQSVPYESIAGTLVDFDELVLSDPAGTLLEGLVASGGVSFGERFDGQELAVARVPRPGAVPAQDWFDDLGFGAPLPGLTLLAGAAGANLGGYVYADVHATALAGIGPDDGLGSDPFGLGAISARFDDPVSAFGLQLRESDGGEAWLALYRGDGSLIQQLALGPLQDGFVGFARSDGTADIAGFSLWHRDTYYGIAIDNLVYTSVVPEPGPLALWLAGLAAMGTLARRRPAR